MSRILIVTEFWELFSGITVNGSVTFCVRNNKRCRDRKGVSLQNFH